METTCPSRLKMPALQKRQWLRRGLAETSHSSSNAHWLSLRYRAAATILTIPWQAPGGSMIDVGMRVYVYV
jgi:hypothetical protein